MSSAELSKFITRALNDENMRQTLESNPDAAFEGYSLTGEEKDAVRSVNEAQLRALGLDPMTARSWTAFHDVEHFAPDRPDASGDLPPTAS
jgi:hypothetical protein